MGLFSSLDSKYKEKISNFMLEIDDKYAQYEESVRYFGGSVDPAITHAYKFFKQRMQSLLSK